MMRPRHVLMTVDCVGGVWRYAVDLARGLNGLGIACLLAGCGPRPAGAHALDLPGTELVWTDAALDWMADDEAALDDGAGILSALARDRGADLLHLNLPSQAVGIGPGLPVLAVSHSCVPTWWEAVRGGPLPEAWAWQRRRNRAGFDRADCVLTPSASHAASLRRVYGPVERLRVVHNATDARGPDHADKQPVVLAAGRWWDEGKDAATLDLAARSSPWPVRMAGPLHGPTGQGISLHHASALGAMPAAELLEAMGDAAIFAAPSRYEPFGLAVLEAAMRQAALVLADIPVFRELWEGAAVFAAPGDADGFARAIEMLARDAPRRARLGAAAARIARGLTVQRQLDGVLAGYAEAMTRRQRILQGAG